MFDGPAEGAVVFAYRDVLDWPIDEVFDRNARPRWLESRSNWVRRLWRQADM